VRQCACLSLQRECLTNSSSTRAFSHLSLRVLFITITLTVKMMTAVIESDHVMYLSALNMRYDWFFLEHITFDRWFTASADKNQQESTAVAGKPHVRCHCKIRYVSKWRNLQRHRAVFPAIARLSCIRIFGVRIGLRWHRSLKSAQTSHGHAPVYWNRK